MKSCLLITSFLSLVLINSVTKAQTISPTPEHMTSELAAYCYAQAKSDLARASSDLAQSKRNLDEASEKSRLYSHFRITHQGDKELVILYETRMAYFEGAADALSLGFLKSTAGSVAMSAFKTDEEALSRNREHQTCINSCPIIDAQAMQECGSKCIKKAPAELHRIRRCAAFTNNRKP